MEGRASRRTHNYSCTTRGTSSSRACTALRHRISPAGRHSLMVQSVVCHSVRLLIIAAPQQENRSANGLPRDEKLRWRRWRRRRRASHGHKKIIWSIATDGTRVVEECQSIVEISNKLSYWELHNSNCDQLCAMGFCLLLLLIIVEWNRFPW